MKPIKLIDLKAQQPLVRAAIEQRFSAILDHGQYILGPENTALENKLADFVGVKHAVACSNGTDAILMMLMACGIKQDDVVFLPAFTFPSTAEVVALLGAKPYFVDVEQETMNLCPIALEQAICAAKADQMSLGAILNVNLFGLASNYQRINQIAQQYELAFLTDAAQSFAAQVDGQYIEQLSLVTTTSFYPAKPLGCYGDGGAVFTDDTVLYERMVSIRNHGSKHGSKYDLEYVGLNARLNGFQAAVLLEKIKLFDQEVAVKHQVAQWYDQHLDPRIKRPLINLSPGSRQVWAQFTVQFPDEITRSEAIKACKANHIDTAIYYPKLISQQQPYASYSCYPAHLPVSQLLCQTVCSLPMHAYLSKQDVLRVCDTVNASMHVIQDA